MWASSTIINPTSLSPRDIFITAPTGAGKSMIFQLPSIYLAQKYKKLIIFIEPVAVHAKIGKSKYFFDCPDLFWRVLNLFIYEPKYQ